MEKVKEYAKSVLIALIIAFAIRATIVQAYIIPSGSMKPTIMENDRIFGNKFVYFFADPDFGDIVVFTPPEAAHTDASRFVKRVIGLEGDWIEIRDGVVYRNEKPLDEPYIKQTPDYTVPLFRVPDGQVFVLGDNRRNSMDSHVWGFLPKKAIFAKAMFRFWPLSRIGLVK